MFRKLATLMLVGWMLTGCPSAPGGDQHEPRSDASFADGGTMDEDQDASNFVTYHAHIRPLVETHCLGCHREGGIGPFVFDDFASLKTHAPMAWAAIESGRMPPWQADPDCRRYKDERMLSEEQKELFRQWMDGGMQEGDESDYVEPEPTRPPLGDPDIVGRQTGPYAPAIEGGDEYRCFLMDAEFPEDTFLRAVDIDPGERSVVHHANMFLIAERHVAKARELEAQDGQPGWDCFGETGVPTLDLINAWVPGAQPIELEDDLGVYVPAGAAMIMQVHFNTLYADPVPVETKLNLWTLDETPAKTGRGLPIADLGIEIPAGESHSEHVIEIPNLSEEPWEVFGAAAHLHLLGKSAKMEIVRKDGSEECLLDIPDWDFAWQQAYFFEDDDWSYVQPGDKVRLTCVFDNSAENQPIIDGERQQPRDVKWGGGSTDEMCLSFLIIAEQYEPASDGELCGGFSTCRENCEEPDTLGCVLSCGTEDKQCADCLLNRAINCVRRHCDEELEAARPCLLTCAQGAQAGGNIDACLREECPAEREALESCMQPVVQNGHCDADVAPCNVSLAD